MKYDKLVRLAVHLETNNGAVTSLDY